VITVVIKQTSMFKNYFIIAARNLRNKPVFSFLNIIGLSIGIACCMVVALFVIDQFSYDAHHENSENIYRVVHRQLDGPKPLYVAVTQGPLAPELIKVFPEIQKATRVGFTDANISVRGAEPFHQRLMAVDPQFFEIFTIPFVAAPTSRPVEENQVVISEEASVRLFGKKNAVGEIISIPGYIDLKVTGVFRDFPSQSHLHADFIISFTLIEKTEAVASSWNSNSYYNYLLMPEGLDKESFDAKMNGFIHKHIPKNWKSFEYFLQPLRSINLSPGYLANPSGSIGKIIITGFSIVGGIILMLACLNYMNLSTARSAKRSVEVGVRKVVGAQRSQIIWQFMTESLIICLLSLLLAILWADIAVPLFNTFTGFKLQMLTFLQPRILIWLVGCVLLLTLIAGSYPAFYLSRFVPALVLKGQKNSDSSRTVRKGLVILQFTVTTALVILVIVVLKQTNFMQNQDLGFNKNELIIFAADLNKNVGTESFKNELYKIPGVEQITVASEELGARNVNSTALAAAGHEGNGVKIDWMFTDHDYIPTLGLQLLAGRNFRSNGSDVDRTVIINEEAAAGLGWSAEEAVGKKVTGFIFRDSLPGEVIGVIKNFHLSPLRKAINPLVIGYQAENSIYIAKISGNLFNAKNQIDKIGSQFIQGGKLESRFLEETLQESYGAERKTGQLLGVFTCLAILLGCSGLYALSSYEAEQKIKELGIRKIMGASSSQLLVILSGNFLKLILISLVIGMPIAYFLGNIWLQVYAYRIGWTIDIFLISSMAILGLACLTIISQTLKASRLNPVDALRYE
jgi:putative ABC transport system permease protein